MMLAFGKFQLLIGSLNYVMPQLAISAGLFNKLTEVGNRVIWPLPGKVGSVVDIINKAQLKNGSSYTAVRGLVLCWTVCFGCIDIIQSAG